MHGISSIIYIILVACLLPYAFTVIAKFTGGFQPVDNQNPRDFLANTKGIAARANAVQQNSFESLPLFLTAILMAEYMVVPEYFILRLGCIYYFTCDLWHLLLKQLGNFTLYCLVFIIVMPNILVDRNN